MVPDGENVLVVPHHDQQLLPVAGTQVRQDGGVLQTTRPGLQHNLNASIFSAKMTTIMVSSIVSKPELFLVGSGSFGPDSRL